LFDVNPRASLEVAKRNHQHFCVSFVQRPLAVKQNHPFHGWSFKPDFAVGVYCKVWN